MLLFKVIKGVFSRSSGVKYPLARKTGSTNSVLNVGGGNKLIDIPAHYENWEHLLLDIDPSSGADIILDARKLSTLTAEQFDAIYCSHNLEHYYAHDVPTVLSGFFHALKSDGFVEIHVPDMRAVLTRFVETGMEIDDILYQSPSGPISVLDVIYGWGKQIESTGVDFYAHKTGFTEVTLLAALKRAGFTHIWIARTADPFAVGAFAFKQSPTATQISRLGLATG